MQEHEYIYEQGYLPVRDTEQENNQEISRTETGTQKDEQIHDEVVIEDLDEKNTRNARLWPGRLTVLALLLSFLALLAALWLPGTLLSAPDQLLPVSFLQMLADHRILVLAVPALGLVLSYARLRALTAAIMAVPERRLDERQKMLRDQAHRSAFTIIKAACVVIPAAFLLPHLPWFNQPTPAAPVGMPAAVIYGGPTWQFNANGLPLDTAIQPGSIDRIILFKMHPFYMQPPAPAITPASGPELAIATALLLVGLLLVVSALPMAVLAWKGNE